jgi:hypothetical protein
MTVRMLAEKLDLECISNGDGNREVTGCYVGDLLSRVMGSAKEGNVWVTIMSNVNVAAVASLADVSCIILAEGVKPDADLEAKLEIVDAALYTTPMASYEIAWKIHELIGV